MPNETSLTVNEIFHSIQGESTHAGRPCVFVRLTECDLRCVWCDTPYAFHEGKAMTIDAILAEVAAYRCSLVELTGGEPLLQPEAIALIRSLCDSGYELLIETGGHLDIGPVDPRATVIMDLKCPGSRMDRRNRWENIPLLKPRDEVKFVIIDRSDYEWAREVVRTKLAGRPNTVLFSPVFGRVENVDLAEWIMADRLPVRFQVQLHKYIWEPTRRGV